MTEEGVLFLTTLLFIDVNVFRILILVGLDFNKAGARIIIYRNTLIFFNSTINKIKQSLTDSTNTNCGIAIHQINSCFLIYLKRSLRNEY